MIEYYKKVVLENYANFNGRATRSEYWCYALTSVIISIILMTIDKVSKLTFGVTETGILGLIYSLLVLIPGLAVKVRRLHDVGKSGWFLLIAFTGIGLIWLLILFCQDSEDETNQYGKDPNDIFSDEIDEIGTAEA